MLRFLIFQIARLKIANWIQISLYSIRINMKNNIYILAASVCILISIECLSRNSDSEQIAARTYLQSSIPLAHKVATNVIANEIKIDASHISDFAARELALSEVFKETKVKPAKKTRGAKEINVFNQIAQGTVLITTKDGIGSGALVTNSGHIVTNYHVVGDNDFVNVFFRPPEGVELLQKKDTFLGKVIKVNVFKDLALVKIDRVPQSARAIILAENSPKIGEDAHAIGHPEGEFWTYTKGYVSAVRKKYQWATSEKDTLKEAKIVQTQTPINPGNSGGPLINDNKQLIGINSFTRPKSPGLNYAVAVEEIKEFLSQEGSRRPTETTNATTPSENCKVKELSTGEDKDEDGIFNYVLLDVFCTGKANALIKVPTDSTKPIKYLVDTNSDGKFDIVVLDLDRDKKWDISYHDTNFDGIPDLVGKHPDGNIMPSSYEALSG